MVPEPHLPDALVQRVLARLGIPAPRPDADGLGALYLAWCREVPWDNVQKRIAIAEGRPVLAGAEPVEFFENFLRDGTGGTCWPSSGALHALLTALGFDARRVIGDMQMRTSGKSPTHGAEIVRVDGAEWLVDSSMLNERPFELRRSEVTAIADGLHPMRAEPNADGMWLVTWQSYGRDEPITCWIYEDDATHQRFLERYEASRVKGFSYGLTFRKNRPDGVLAFGRSTRSFKDAKTLTITRTDVADRVAGLIGEGGLSPEIVARLPEDEPEPPQSA